MKQNNHRSIKLFCFSPPVMIATMAIEVLMASYVVVRYHMNDALRLIVAALSMLGLFQLSEYFVCGGLGADGAAWSRVGFVAITALPALGLHLLYVIAGQPGRRLIMASYATMAGFMTYFVVASNAFIGHECTGNYVIFQIGANPSIAYSLYYYGLLVTALVLGYVWAGKANISKKGKAQVLALMAGYLVFLLPTGIANSVKPETRAGIPSIMCGFAVLFALILVLYIAPKAGTLRETFSLKFFR